MITMENSFKPRVLGQLLPEPSFARLVVITGARQTGKTTLSREKYRHLKYINLDAPENRELVRLLATPQWGESIGNSIIDEAHKEPSVFEKVKYAFDERQITFSVLTGSSQILLLRQVRESLAGRAFFYELWPMMQCELRSIESSTEVAYPLLASIISEQSVGSALEDVPKRLVVSDDIKYIEAERYLLNWGGMPALLDMSDAERWTWLKNYGYTYLERDLADLARLNDLMPFRKFQKLSALRSSMLLNYSEIARDTGVSVDTARRYLEYLRISYQTILLQPYYKNLTSSVVKTPKIFWLDTGIWRQLTGFRGEITGQIYESMVVAEIIKWIRTSQCEGELYFYRTKSGLEVDLILELPMGCVAMEIKTREKVTSKDARPVKVLAQSLSDKWLGGLIIYRGDSIVKLEDPDIWAVPSRRLFQSPVPA